ncbi:MAG: hypothetical protein RIS14_1008 [Pseudomonadota bacterium]
MLTMLHLMSAYCLGSRLKLTTKLGAFDPCA